MDWVLITKFGNNPIGAIGFVGDDAVAIAAFYDDRDGNQDGKVSLLERFAAKISIVRLDGLSVTEVAMQARVDPDVLERDPSFAQVASQIYLNFAKGLILDGIYAAYFARGVSMTGKGIAQLVTSSTVKGFVVRKGFEGVVKDAFYNVTGR
ncbi:hypothetical protein CRT60_08825 [Azospirillum palustre]|uniref:Uncharacterized protein n=1 Tax=Azospirillum palustre TaxID=2044885 RepID=A0A2B8BKH9_9PROT|nr:hypothetical protein [Azospirillum palustre]PGH58048.1 hypothetical protein CRT60_08825 [Azospirillum palustre]